MEYGDKKLYARSVIIVSALLPYHEEQKKENEKNAKWCRRTLFFFSVTNCMYLTVLLNFTSSQAYRHLLAVYYRFDFWSFITMRVGRENILLENEHFREYYLRDHANNILSIFFFFFLHQNLQSMTWSHIIIRFVLQDTVKFNKIMQHPERHWCTHWYIDIKSK